jgi:hypothetical protein
MDNGGYSNDGGRSFDEIFEQYWMRTCEGAFGKDVFLKLTETVTAAVSPLKPLMGQFAFTAYDPAHLWSDNSDVFFKAWCDMLIAHYRENTYEAPLLFIGFHLADRFSAGRKAWGLLATDSALYVSARLWGDEAPRRYAYPKIGETPDGWASAFASQAVSEMDPEGIAQLAKLSNEPPDFGEEDNPGHHEVYIGKSSPGQMAQLIRTELTLALDAFAGIRSQVAEMDAAVGRAQGKEAGPTRLDRRLVELGLGEYAKLGTDARQAKHLKKFAAKLGIESGENIVFTFSDATFAGVYGLAVTDRAIRSRDLMEDPVSQTLRPGAITADGKTRTLVIGGGPIHYVGAYLPERLMPALATLLGEYLDGKILA